MGLWLKCPECQAANPPEFKACRVCHASLENLPPEKRIYLWGAPPPEAPEAEPAEAPAAEPVPALENPPGAPLPAHLPGSGPVTVPSPSETPPKKPKKSRSGKKKK
uniref:Uncharacterized protein n=1 Tax=Desulfobacca acetoxidans TaxID=60893 RepID=A0A7V4G8E9_9BACT